MRDASRFALATICGLVLAGIVHIVAILTIPWLGEQDALSRLRSTAAADRAELVSAPGAAAAAWLPSPDPAVAIAACAYNLDEGPLRVTARMRGMFQSISFHGRGGGVYFAITDRAAIRGALDLVVMTRAQLEGTLALEDEEEPSRDLRIVAPSREGFAIVRVLATFPSMRAEAEEAAKAVSCSTDPPPGES